MSISSIQNTTVPGTLPLEAKDQNNTNAVDSETATKSLSTTTKEKPTFFENFLNRSDKSSRPSNEILNKKLVDIRHKAKLIKSHPLPGIVKDYIQEVKGFLTDVKDHAFEHQKNEDGLFEKMELVDRKLSEIGDKVLEDNKEEISLVASLGELEGLLIDFYI